MFSFVGRSLTSGAKILGGGEGSCQDFLDVGKASERRLTRFPALLIFLSNVTYYGLSAAASHFTHT